MKKFFQLIFFVLLSTVAFSQPITSGLIGYWPFNGSANESINGVNGSVSNATLTTDRFDSTDRAFSFNYHYDHIRTTDMLRTSKSMAVSIWVYPNAAAMNANYRWLINQRDNSAGGDQFQITYNDQDTRLVIFDSNKNGQGVICPPLQANTWNHIVFQTSGEAGDLLEGWINNVYQGSVILTNDMSYNVAEEITFGVAGWNLTQGTVNGKIDEAMIFDRILTSAEVQALYEYNENTISNGLWEQNSTNIYHLGKVAINGSDLPSGFDLSVNGKIVTKEVKVTLNEWPDFVFDKDHELKPLREIEKFITENGHLPSMPKEAEVLKNGIEVGEMNAKLLQKIEELTLYLIEQSKQLKEANENIAQLQKEVSSLKNR